MEFIKKLKHIRTLLLFYYLFVFKETDKQTTRLVYNSHYYNLSYNVPATSFTILANIPLTFHRHQTSPGHYCFSRNLLIYVLFIQYGQTVLPHTIKTVTLLYSGSHFSPLEKTVLPAMSPPVLTPKTTTELHPHQPKRSRLGLP